MFLGRDGAPEGGYASVPDSGDALPAFSDEDRLLLDRLHEKARHVSRQATETEFPTVLATP